MVEPVIEEGNNSKPDYMLKSYKIENNPKYFEILEIMKKLK